MKKALVIKRWDGGWSTDAQLGIEHSFAYSKHLDFRKKPSQLTVLPATRKESGGIVGDLVQNEVMLNNGSTVAIGDTGKFYTRSAAGVWNNESSLDNGAFGLSYRRDTDAVYISSEKTVSEYSPISSTPVMKPNKYAASKSTDSLATSTGGALTTAILVAASPLDETAINIQAFKADIEPLSSIRVYIETKGSGDWTLTLHDPTNNVLATSTVTNANLVSGSWNTFSFSSQIRLYVKPNAREYHFHLTSTVADGTVRSIRKNDLNTADYEIYADRLIDTNNGMHPIQTFLQYECIGNERYLSVWEPLTDEPTNAEWERHKLTFPPGYEVCGLAIWNEYLAIACEKRSTGTNTPQDGRIFFWDGLADTYNFSVPVPEGSPYALHEHKNVLYYEAGGAWFAYSGGTPQKLRTMPNTDSEFSNRADQTITYPYMATVRKGQHLLGFPSQTTNQSLEHGVYEYGAVDKNFPDSFGYSYTASHGTILNNGTNNLRIGMVKNFGDSLHISWRLNNTYGVDVVDNTSSPFATAEWHSAFFDDGLPSKEKTPLYIECTFEALPAGATVALKYRTSRSGTFTIGTPVTSSDTVNNYAKLPINDRFHEIQLGLDLTATTATTATPTITSVALMYDDNRKEAFS